MFGRVVQIGRARVLELSRTEARPGQAEIVTAEVISGFLVLAALAFERLDVKQMHVAHMRFQPLWTLTGVADGPNPFVDFAQDVFRHGLIEALDLLHLVVLGQFLAKAQTVGKLLHDHVVAAAFPQGLNDLLAPLQGSVRCRDRATGFKLSRCRQ